MNKHDIIQQWIEDQKEVDPEVLGWLSGKSHQQLSEIIWSLKDYTLTYHSLSSTYEVETEFGYETLFSGKISNQGELRILMKMLNIQ